MGSRRNPGKYDCAARALFDEEQFTLLARDPEFPFLVMQWANKRAEAVRRGERPQADLDVMLEAMECAVRGARWRKENEGRWRVEAVPTPLTTEEIIRATRVLTVRQLRGEFLHTEPGEYRTQVLAAIGRVATSPLPTIEDIGDALP